MGQRGCIKVVEDKRGKRVVDANGNDLPGVVSVRVDMSSGDSVLTVVFHQFQVEIEAPSLKRSGDGNG